MKLLRWTCHATSIVTLIHLFCACASAQSSRPREGQQKDTTAQNQQITAEQLQPVTTELRAIASEIRAIREQQTEAEKRHAADEARQREGVYWPPIWSNWVLSGVAFLTLLALVKQVAANVRAADAAENTFRWAERAYLSPGQWTLHGFKEFVPGKTLTPTIGFAITNTGRTPAYGHQIVGVIRIGTHLLDEPNYKDGDVIDEVGTTFYPQEEYERLLDMHTLTAELHRAVMAGRAQLWLFGYITYRLVFPVDTGEHTVKFLVHWDRERERFFIENRPGYCGSD